MKEYIKPYIEDENVELEDIVAASGEYDWNNEDGFDIDPIIPKQ